MYTKKFTNAESSTRGFEWQKKLFRSMSRPRLCWLHHLIKHITQHIFLVAFFVAKWQEDLLSTSFHTSLLIYWLTCHLISCVAHFAMHSFLLFLVISLILCFLNKIRYGVRKSYHDVNPQQTWRGYSWLWL
jgi:hypothetical protein